MRPTLTTARPVTTLRALAPLVLCLCCLVVGFAAVTDSAGATSPPHSQAPTQASAAAPTNHTGNVTLYDAGDGTFEDAAAVERAIERGELSAPGTMAVNETLLVVIESERLASAMDDHDGATTERFAAALDGPADLYLVQTNPTTMVTRTFALVGTENATAYRDGETVYVFLDTGALSFRKKYTDGFRTHDSFRKDRFAVDFGFDLYEPPWEPPGDPPWGPTFALSDEEYLTPTATPTDSPTPTRTPTPTTTPTAPPLTPGLNRTATTGTSGETPMPAVEPNGTDAGAETRTTTFETGPGFTPGTTLVALLVAALLGRRRR